MTVGLNLRAGGHAGWYFSVHPRRSVLVVASVGTFLASLGLSRVIEIMKTRARMLDTKSVDGNGTYQKPHITIHQFSTPRQ